MKCPLPICGLLGILAAAAASLGQPPTPAADGQQLVLLRNGNVLSGQVDVVGSTCRVLTGTSEIRLPTRDVECVVGSLTEAYEVKRQTVREDSAADHLELAAWCIRQELWPQASSQLERARQISPRHPALEPIERRLEVVSRAALRASRQQVTPTAPSSAPVSSDTPQPSLEELESLAASLPPGVLEDFSRHIQPILVNGCAAAGCHATDDPREFRLNRDLLRGLANRESTLRNLEAVWQAIDHRHPRHSPLLMQPAVPHGGLPRPVFAGHRQRAYERLEAWVLAATGQAEPAPTPQVELATHEADWSPLAAGPQLTAPAPQPAPTPGAAPLPSRTDESPVDGERSLHFWEVQPTTDDPARPSVQRGVEPKKFTPRDEFDPELFNRQRQAAASDE